jgi:5-formyltetrahydrofolate cyclo-ligase
MSRATEEKQTLREELARRFASLWGQRPGPLRPPLFPGRGKAAERLRRLPVWRRARVVAVMPDEALLQVRVNALADGKTLIAATPGLKQGLVRITPGQVPVARRPRELAGSALVGVGTPLRFPHARLEAVELVVGACLAVDQRGCLLGDGRGLLDLLWTLLGAVGGVWPDTPVAVLAADEQVVEALPRQEWDLAASLVVTPTRVITSQVKQPPPRLEGLPPRLAKLPVVKGVRALRGRARR